MAVDATENLCRFFAFGKPEGRYQLAARLAVPIPTKPPVYNGMIAPRDSWMMPPPFNEIIPPGAPRMLAEKFFH